jgi:hypothetical protein
MFDFVSSHRLIHTDAGKMLRIVAQSIQLQKRAYDRHLLAAAEILCRWKSGLVNLSDIHVDITAACANVRSFSQTD